MTPAKVLAQGAIMMQFACRGLMRVICARTIVLRVGRSGVVEEGGRTVRVGRGVEGSSEGVPASVEVMMLLWVVVPGPASAV